VRILRLLLLTQVASLTLGTDIFAGRIFAIVIGTLTSKFCTALLACLLRGVIESRSIVKAVCVTLIR
jgi:hypothetical protein